MRSNGWKLFFAALLAVVGSTAVAGADEMTAAQRRSMPPQAFPWFVGLGLGAGYATISHPELLTGGTTVPMLSLYGGYTFGDHLTVGLEVAGSEIGVGRDRGTEPFKIGYKPNAIWEMNCWVCDPRPSGADVNVTSLVFGSLGARAEYTPFGRDGLFVSGMAGLAFQVGLGDDGGFGFGARVGYRYRATNIMTVSIEAGMTGQIYGDTTMYMPFGAAVVRPYFLSGIRPYPKARKPPPVTVAP